MSDTLPLTDTDIDEEEEDILEPKLRVPLAPTAGSQGPLRCSPQTQYAGARFDGFPQCFEEVGKLGEGAFSETIRVKRRDNGQEYALKKLKFPTRAGTDGINALDVSKEELGQVETEVQALQSLSNGAGGQCHPNVVCYYDHFILVEPNEQGVPTERYALLMQVVPGQTVASLYEQGRSQGKTVTPQRLRQMLASGLSALAYVHGKGIAHNDIKPENLMVTPSGDIVLIDLGLSCYAHGGSQEPHQYVCTHTHSGTPAYMSPEVQKGFIDGTPLENGMTEKGDIWGLGVSLLELATLQLLYDAPGVADLYCQVNSKIISIANPSGAEAESATLLSMLEKDWHQRPTAEQALAQLREPIVSVGPVTLAPTQPGVPTVAPVTL
jgi:serine/threonine protein kinase